jgi:hypothetical protein
VGLATALIAAAGRLALDRVEPAVDLAAAHRRQAACRGRHDHAATADGSPAQRLSMGMLRDFFDRISEHVIKEAQETAEATRC